MNSYLPPNALVRAEVAETLRDRFAIAAMQGIVASIDSEDNYRRLREHATAAGRTVSEWISREAYKQADAMLRERGYQ